jgi:hypothetical protein
MLKLLYILFRKRFNKFAFDSQSHKKGLDNAEKCFIDSEGNNYYRFKNDFDIPIYRLKEIQYRISIIKSGLNDNNISSLIKIMKDAFNSPKKVDLAEIGYIITEIERRQNIFINTDLIMDIVCLTYIREDEKPEIVDWNIHKQKVERLKIDSMGGLYDFFCSSGIMQLLPFVGTTKEDWEQFYKESELKTKAMEMYLSSRITERNL